MRETPVRIRSGVILNELELFAGAGGGILGSQLLGHTTVCAVEFDAYARSVLLARQADRTFPPFPVWDDVRTFDGHPWRGIVDVVSGGFPCQDISVAGKGAGITGARSGLWSHMARIIGEVRPRFAFVENSPALLTRGIGVVLGDLAALGYDARWTVLGAADVGAPHIRDRLWILATLPDAKHRGIPERRGIETACSCGDGSHGIRNDGKQGMQEQEGAILPDSDDAGQRADSGAIQDQRNHIGGVRSHVPDSDSDSDSEQGQFACFACAQERQEPGIRPAGPLRTGGLATHWSEWPSERGVARVVNGMAHRRHRIKASGNGQVPRVRAAAWRMLGGP